VQQTQCKRSGPVVGGIEIEYNNTRAGGHDQIFYSVQADTWFKTARVQIAMKQHQGHQLNDIRVPENQRDIYACIHGVLHSAPALARNLSEEFRIFEWSDSWLQACDYRFAVSSSAGKPVQRHGGQSKSERGPCEAG
jgi:hypothetical protein